MDTDATSSKSSYEKMITAFADGKYDILVGTQMVAKGLNFPNVTLVGFSTLTICCMPMITEATKEHFLF